MRKVLTLACLLAVTHYINAQCASPTYTETFIPECAQNDVFVKWPNYENPQSYYTCNGVNKPTLQTCPNNQYFCYVMQSCVPCASYLPAAPCTQLKTQNPPKCVAMGGGTTGAPSPSDGTAAPATEPTTKTTKTTKATVATEPTEPTVPTVPITMPTPPTEPVTPGSTIPPPPSPVTNNPDIPMPPTPGPTPPSVSVSPPVVTIPPTS